LIAPTAQAAGTNGRIAYVCPKAGQDGVEFDTDICTVDPDGTDPVDLTNSDTVGDASPAYSPSGDQIAWTRGTEVWIMDEDGSDSHKVVGSVALRAEPTWSQDGTRIAFIAPVAAENVMGLFVVPVTGGLPKRLPTGGDTASPAWSPVGERIAYVRTDEYECCAGDPEPTQYGGLHTIGSDGSSPAAVRSSSTFYALNPFWSPDGSQLGFYRAEVPSGEQSLERVAQPGGQTITPAWTFVGNASFSPDGTKVAYEDFDDSDNLDGILVRSADGSGTATPVAATGREPSWGLDESESSPPVVIPPTAPGSLPAAPVPPLCGRKTVQKGDGKPISGTAGRDTLTGSALNDQIHGLAGQDQVDGGAGNDCVFGDENKDRIRGQAGNDLVDGGPGNDLVDGKNGDDVVRGGTGMDVVIGGAGTDQMEGGPGSDFMTDGTKSRNRYYGQDGQDTIVSWNGERDLVDCGPDKDEARVDQFDHVVHCEDVLRRISRRRERGTEVGPAARQPAPKVQLQWLDYPHYYVYLLTDKSDCGRGFPYGSIFATVQQQWVVGKGKTRHFQVEFRLRLKGGYLNDTSEETAGNHWGAPTDVVTPNDYRSSISHSTKSKNPWWRRGARFNLSAPKTPYKMEARVSFYLRILHRREGTGEVWTRKKRSKWFDLEYCTSAPP
jgi:hypothetical protein